MSYVTGAKGVGDFLSNRLKYNLDDAEVFEPAKKETPWLSFQMKLSRQPVNASTFKSFSNTPSWIDRQFYIRAAGSWSSSAVGATNNNITVSSAATGTAASVGFLVAGLVLRIKTTGGDTLALISAVDSQTQIDLLSLTATPNAVADTDVAQVVGVAMGETSSAATAVNSVLSINTHYCQDFENEWSMSNQAEAEVVFGPDEWTRLAAETLRTHKTDINRALLLGIGNDATSLAVGGETVSVRTTDGLVTFAESNSSTLMNGGGVLTPSYATYTYNDFVNDMENQFALGSQAKVGVCGSSVLAFFQKIGSGSFLAGANVNVQNAETSFGMNITKIMTPFGTLALVWDKVLRGSNVFANYMAVADIEYCKYRELSGNGHNFATHLLTNTQNPNQFRTRKYGYRTVAGSQYNTPSVHGLWKFVA